ncbi:hypothetical protein AWC38_SpisGene16788 [Stylophora pistillata]|uniref:RNA-directed DNA polymerase from mobile element jockey n=1 Tax=Stylophora pistillata TaxID=50429 RepID=A0A2B4RR72_STYPI|nr:hypothetical protein AWC38_SpisGene16788 [Stylophora pistillata]
MGLQEHVKRPTHIHGHTLDLLITRQSDVIIAKEPEIERYFSDHAVVLCDLRKLCLPLKSRTLSSGNSKQLTSNSFHLEDIRNSSLGRDPPNTLDELVECYNNTLRSVLDKHAPIRARHLKSQSRPPWFNDEIVKARRERRSAERKWRASRLNSDLAVFKAKRNLALHVMNESRRAYYKQYIDENSSDQGRLFRASKRLSNFHVDRALLPDTDARRLANEMGEYFVHKIAAIRSELDADTSGATSLATSASTCKDWKNALVHPLPKKAGLKPINYNKNFRPTSEADAVIAIENWMRDDKLMLNDNKTEFLIIGTERQLSKVSVDKIKIGQAEVSPISSVRNLGTWFDSHLDMSTHVTKACACAFYYLYNIQHIRKYLSRESTEKPVHAFITCRLDYCNGLLYGAPECQIKKLQRVMNANAR